MLIGKRPRISTYFASFSGHIIFWAKKKKILKKSGSCCTWKQINKCGAQWPQRRDHPHRVCGVPYHPHLLLLRLHGRISQAQMGFFRHEKQSMTCAQQWQADDEPAPFDDGLCRRGPFFDVEEYKGSVVHYGCTGGRRSNESHFVPVPNVQMAQRAACTLKKKQKNKPVSDELLFSL